VASSSAANRADVSRAGVSERIHGNPQRQASDRALSEELRARGSEAPETAASKLGDRASMAQHVFPPGAAAP
jgi:hypothetical protein